MSSTAVARNTMHFSTSTTLVAASFQFAIQTFPKPQDAPAPPPTAATMSYSHSCTAVSSAPPACAQSSRRTYRVDECDMARAASSSWISSAARRLTPSTSRWKPSASSSSSTAAEECTWHLQRPPMMHFIGQQGLAPADGADIAFLSGSYEQNRMPGVAMPLAQEGRGYVNPSEKALDGWCKKGKGKRNTVRLLLEFPSAPGAQPLREVVEMSVTDQSGRALDRAQLAKEAIRHYEAFFYRSVVSGKWANLLQTPSRRAWDFRQLRLISLHFRVDERGMGCCIPEIGIVERSPPA